MSSYDLPPLISAPTLSPDDGKWSTDPVIRRLAMLRQALAKGLHPADAFVDSARMCVNDGWACLDIQHREGAERWADRAASHLWGFSRPDEW